ncbi:hypothetical protein Dimus_036033 [Dionaea muscipula]
MVCVRDSLKASSGPPPGGARDGAGEAWRWSANRACVLGGRGLPWWSLTGRGGGGMVLDGLGRSVLLLLSGVARSAVSRSSLGKRSKEKQSVCSRVKMMEFGETGPVVVVFLDRKKEVATPMVRGVKIELDNNTLASILGVPGETVKDHELPHGDWLTMVFEAFDVPLIAKQGAELKRRRYDEIDAPAVNEEVFEEEEVQHEFDWESVNEEAEIQGESGSAEKFLDPEDEVQGSKDVIEEVPAVSAPTSVQ